MTVRLWEGARFRSRDCYVVMVMWNSTTLWIAGLIYLAIHRNEMPIILAIVALVAFCLTAPRVGDLSYLFAGYVEEWERDNEVEDSG